MADKIVLIDGHSILNRAFYGVPDLTNAAGEHTNAVYGFLNIMFKILEEEKPQYLVVAFDVKAPTFRHELYQEYKGTRKGMPDELREQVPVMKDVLKAMQIKIVELPGFEADDILGTLAYRAEAQGMEVALVSGDRDLLQIATGKIKIRIPKSKGGKTEVEDYYAEDVKNRYSVTPAEFIELKALMGDTADNIPGVPRVGEKTATQLIVEYHNIDTIYEHLEEISKNAIRESLRENRPLADLSRKLAEINKNSPVELDFSEALMKNFYTEEAFVLYKKLELKNFLGRFDRAATTGEAETKSELIQEQSELLKLIKTVLEDESVTRAGFYLFKEKEEALGFSFAWGEKAVFCPFSNQMEEMLLENEFRSIQKQFLKRGMLCTFDIKNQLDFLNTEELAGYVDVLIGAYLLNPLKNDYSLEDIANEYLKILLQERNLLFGKKSLKEAMQENLEKFSNYAAYYALVPVLCGDKMKEKLEEQGMDTLYEKVEMPLTVVLHSMEKYGVKVVPEKLDEYSKSLTGRITELEQSIYEQAGEESNINSPKQLAEILFEKLGLPGGKKTKTGYSTAADILEKLAGEYPIVENILEYRGLAKLKSTYAEGLKAFISEDKRIRSTFHQTITATGRISSTEPNLQNIPMKTELGRQIRKVFVPEEGYVFVDADYSQIELRLLAHMSGDKQLIEAYQIGEDIHRITASKVFHTPFEEVTSLQRRNAKAVNFGIVYGISSFGLSQGLSITRKEAQNYINQYFETYPGVKKFLDKLIADAKENGYVTTMFGRRRPVPELKSSNFMQRSFGERVAMNAPIQGSAADIMKIAMINVYFKLKEQVPQARLILQIHDELLIEARTEDKEKVMEILETQMEQAASLLVKLAVDCHWGKDWYETK